MIYFWRLLVFFVFLFIPSPALAHGQEEVITTAAVVENLVLLLHIVTAVFMAWPLYALITVNERPKVGAPLGDKVDDFMEGIIKKNSVRCYIFQLTAFTSGLYLTWSHEDLGLAALSTNWRLSGKLLGLFILMGILSYVVFSLQPKIDKLFAKLAQTKTKEEIAARINNLRLKRKKLATTCLFILLSILLLAIQIREPLPLLVNLILFFLIGLFCWRVFKKNIPYGWV